MNKEIDNNNFDQFFQDRFAEHGTTPPSGMWDKISADLPESPLNFDDPIRNGLSNHQANPSPYLKMKVLLNPALYTKATWLKLIASAAVITSTAILVPQFIESDEPEYSVRSESYLDQLAPLELTSEDDFIFRKNLIVADPIVMEEKTPLTDVELPIKLNTKELPDNSTTTTTIVKTITTTTTVITTTIVGADTSSESSSFQERDSIIDRVIVPLKRVPEE